MGLNTPSPTSNKQGPQSLTPDDGADVFVPAESHRKEPHQVLTPPDAAPLTAQNEAQANGEEASLTLDQDMQVCVCA